jgi:hypothetical protein
VRLQTPAREKVYGAGMTELPKVTTTVDPPVCVHRWKLGSPVGGVTRGECRECGSFRDFAESNPAGAYLSRHRPRR